MADTHDLIRTSPKGPGQKFVGRCIKCGIDNLTFSDMDGECVNPAGLDSGDALTLALQLTEGGDHD
ncbi:hypothetical protein [Sphingopyxis sp. SCN 67-31]|uniref:hypothetical protein n=1 Tax=Sphingopyxis sp. SCN 67-31 TaxID=1660142 RepID=UPI00086A7538|nr:hypothetical protein [Sphingopyxis sp. SCN 67-31]ODU36612.1 MAG: hypothetical protein ABS88_00025 [Sphingopyxis sp. SCN 67-31]